MMIVSLNSLGQTYPHREILLNGDTTWVFSKAQTLQLVNITLERNAFKEISDSLKLDLERCEFSSFKKDTLISQNNQKINLYSDFINQSLKAQTDLERKLNKADKRAKRTSRIVLIGLGMIVAVMVLK